MPTVPTIDPVAAGRDGSAGPADAQKGPAGHTRREQHDDSLLPESVNAENDPDEQARDGAEGDESLDPDAPSRRNR